MAKKGGVASLISAASKGSRSSKSSTPQIRLTGQLANSLKSFVEHSREEKLAKSLKDEASAHVVEFAKTAVIDKSVEDSTLHKSIKLVTDDASATFVTSSKFKQMDPDVAVPILEGIFGKKFDTYFRISPDIKIKDGITDEQAERLLNFLSENNMLDMIVVKPNVVPTDQFVTDKVLVPKVKQMAEKALEHDLCVQTQYLKAV